eukprot:TRINITY_DN520_c0_g1_i5.p1 TRINITY_DN520_c0_g1~~TRINITY_DN520_c0_g1_i5.p1  ORF type:complete len:468 (+),score=144.97 TRINITY_DN520_c0_g1_i5:32-1405(+)
MGGQFGMRLVVWLLLLVGSVCGKFMAVVDNVPEGAAGVLDINGLKVMILDSMEEVSAAEDGPKVLRYREVFDGEVTAFGKCELSDPEAGWGLRALHTVDGGIAEAYMYNATGGEGVVVYVLDTGVRCSHTVFNGRCEWGANFAPNTTDTDVDGHGTHVAGVIANISRAAVIKAVKVLGDNGTGSWSDVAKGFDWVLNDIKQHGKPSVINLSLGGPADSVINEMVLGVGNSAIMITASGNNGADACTFSPGSAANTINVGNVKLNATGFFLASSSNYGSCVDINAPGTLILSASNADDVRNVYKTGTSMAAPHVAGVVANYLSAAPAGTTYAEARDMLASTALNDTIQDIPPGTPNRFLHVPCDGAVPTNDTLDNCFGRYAHVFDRSGSFRYPANGGNYANNEYLCFEIACSGFEFTVNWVDLEQNIDYLRFKERDSYTAITGSDWSDYIWHMTRSCS